MCNVSSLECQNQEWRSEEKLLIQNPSRTLYHQKVESIPHVIPVKSDSLPKCLNFFFLAPFSDLLSDRSQLVLSLFCKHFVHLLLYALVTQHQSVPLLTL
jgi:hypothetical protein